MKLRFAPRWHGRSASSSSHEPTFRKSTAPGRDVLPVIASALRDLGHDVIAVVEQASLRALTDEEVFSFAAAQGRWLLTENVRDFQPILQQSLQARTAATGLLFTSSRAFPRSRKNPGPLINAIHAWLTTGIPQPPLCEDWLLNPGRDTLGAAT
ncbi:MAG: DUF5615 family PIN-like protein [Streptosporangiaceae bacterium]